MRNASARWLLLVCCVPLMGCALAADFINPSFLAGLGLDPEFFVPTQGRVVIAFNNATGDDALMSVTVSDDPADANSNVYLVTSEILAGGQVQQRVIDCPVGVVLPAFAGGVVGGNFVTLDLQVSGLVAGTDFFCGDVIALNLEQIGAGDAATLRLRVSVLPGG